MIKAHKRITLIISITLIITLLGGCGMIGIYDEDKLQENAIKYMEKKYDETFSIHNCGASETTYDFNLIAEDHKDWDDVYVEWNFKEKKFRDNYMSWYFRDELSQQFQSICREVYPNCIVLNSPGRFQISDKYNMETSFEEYLSTVSTSDYCLFVVADPEQKELDLQRLCDILNEKKQDAYLTIAYVTQDTLESINNSNYEDVYVDKKYTWVTGGFVHHEKPSSSFKWREVN